MCVQPPLQELPGGFLACDQTSCRFYGHSYISHNVSERFEEIEIFLAVPLTHGHSHGRCCSDCDLPLCSLLSNRLALQP